jgi:hypothetical protein
LQLGAAEEGAVTAVGGADEAELIASGVLSRYNRWGVGFSSAMQVSVCLSVCLSASDVRHFDDGTLPPCLPVTF